MLLPPMSAIAPSAEYSQHNSRDSGRTRRRPRRDYPSQDQQPPPPYSPRRLLRPLNPLEQQNAPSALREEDQQPPPPYAPRRTAFLSPSSRPVLTARGDFLRNTDPKVERLRCFLSFTLAIDYDLQDSTPDRLSEYQWADFICLARQLAHACSAAERRDLGNLWYFDDSLSSVMTPVLRLQIVEPAAALGVRIQTILLQMRLFISSLHRCKGFGGYASQLERLPADQGMREFARKLVCDRLELFEAVLPKYPKVLCPYRTLKTQMMTKNQMIIDRWFVSLDKMGFEPNERCSKYKTGVVRFPVETFEGEVKDAMDLSRLLRRYPSDNLCWSRRWKYMIAKRREGRLYHVEIGNGERSERRFMMSAYTLIGR